MMKSVLLALLLVGAVFAQDGTKHPEDNLVTTPASASQPAEQKVAVPEPVNISASVGVDTSAGSVPRIEIDTDGVPVVHGVVMPDDPNDKKVWRNARVLNNVLIERKQKSSSADGSQNVKEQGDMFVYSPETSRILSDESFQPSPVDNTNFSPSLPYPAFYYQRFYQDAKEAEKQLPDSLAVETDVEAENTTDKIEEESETGSDTDGRGFNIKKKNTGITKLKSGSIYGKDVAVTGRPIYYVDAEAAKVIHDDRSPYDYEPAQQSGFFGGSDYSGAQKQQQASNKQDVQYYLQQQQQLLLQQQLQQQQQKQQQQESPQRAGFYQQNSFVPGQVIPANSDSFVIREQNYNNGNGQSFTVPIPIPKEQIDPQQYAQQQYAQQQYAQQQYAQQYQQYYGQVPHYLYVNQQNPNKYASQQAGQQPLDFIGTKLREQVQKARDKFHDITDPVVDPLMEAGQKISANLGLPERVNKINEKVATPGVLVPLAMVGGAALALGGLATTIHLTNAESRNQTLKAIGLGNTRIADKLQTLIKVKRSIESDEYDVAPAGDELDEGKQNVLDHVLSALNGPQKSFLAQLQRTGFDQWQKTPCAKRIFCDVMIQQNDDAIVLMEKRMSTFLSLLDSSVARNLQALTDDVMDGIRRRNCGAFVCGESASE